MMTAKNSRSGQRLERHRNQEGCVKCHSGIDPWGLPFEEYDAGGLLKKGPVDARSKLPDGAVVTNLKGLGPSRERSNQPSRLQLFEAFGYLRVGSFPELQ